MRIPKIFKSNDIVVAEQLAPEQWEVVDTFYGSPRRDIGTMQFDDGETEKMALFGVTTVLFHEKTTGRTRTEYILGTNQNQLEDLEMKVERFGPQRYKSQQNGKVYELRPYQDPNVSVQDLPVKYSPQQPIINGDPVNPGYQINGTRNYPQETR